MRPVCLGLFLLCLLGVRSWADDVPSRLRVCDDVAEYPPFAYYERDGDRKTGTIVGYAVDYLRGILAKSGRDAAIDLLPWRRCMELVRMGQYELTLSAIRTAERDRDFLFTPPYFVLTPVLYAPKSVALASVRTSADLERLKLCGRFGYAYTGYGVPESLVDRGAKTLEAAVGMLRAGRCDVFLGDAEVIAGESRLAGHPIFPDAEFTTRAPPDATAEPMSMMIGRALPQAEALLALLTDGIRDMKAAGAEQALSRRYLAPVSP